MEGSVENGKAHPAIRLKHLVVDGWPVGGLSWGRIAEMRLKCIHIAESQIRALPLHCSMLLPSRSPGSQSSQ